MKRFIYSITAVLLAVLLLVGCSAAVESSQIDRSQAESVEESRFESVEESEIVIDESTTSEVEESVEDTFKDIKSFDTEFSEENVHYYDGYMAYTEILVVLNYMHPRFSYGSFPEYDNAKDDDWFVVGLSCSNEQLEIIKHIGGIEISDHPFLLDKSFVSKLEAAETKDEKQSLFREQFYSRFPGADYDKDPFPQAEYVYIGYFTKPMLLELCKAFDGTSVSYTFMPEIGNNECWFKNLRKS